MFYRGIKCFNIFLWPPNDRSGLIILLIWCEAHAQWLGYSEKKMILYKRLYFMIFSIFYSGSCQTVRDWRLWLGFLKNTNVMKASFYASLLHPHPKSHYSRENVGKNEGRDKGLWLLRMEIQLSFSFQSCLLSYQHLNVFCLL